MADRPTWRDRYPEEVTCIRCLEVHDVMHLDRLLWCDACRRDARNRAAWWGWLGGVLIGAGVALYIWLGIRPTVLVGAWAGTVVAAIWIGQKVMREFAYGVMRFRNRRAVEARPPELPPDDPSE
jgi:hypothetical protein